MMIKCNQKAFLDTGSILFLPLYLLQDWLKCLFPSLFFSANLSHARM